MIEESDKTIEADLPAPTVPSGLADTTPDDLIIDKSLRPSILADFVGQENLKKNLHVVMEAARGRGDQLEHVLLYGPPGLGKTTLAHILAREMKGNLKVTSGPAIERAGDLAALLTNLDAGDMLFIDEIHRLNKVVEEILYPALEDGVLDLMLGKGPGARSIRMDLPKFTIIGATTRIGLISAPLRDRFGLTYHLEYYEPEELGRIITRASGILGAPVDAEATALLASRSRFTPRIANRLLKRIRDYAQVHGHKTINVDAASKAMSMLGVDELGLDSRDRIILETIIDKFGGGPVGLSTLAAAVSEEQDTISDVHEPFLMRQGLLERTPKGRQVTKRGYQHLGRSAPKNNQTLL